MLSDGDAISTSRVVERGADGVDCSAAVLDCSADGPDRGTDVLGDRDAVRTRGREVVA